MRYLCVFMSVVLLASSTLLAQDSLMLPEPRVVTLDDLISEALARNPTVLASLERIPIADLKAKQSGIPDPPELTFRRKEMPGFRWSGAMGSEWELSQVVRFPSKYASESRLGEIQAEHAHHESQEIVNTVLLDLRETYAELWYVQQRLVLENETLRLTERLREVAASRYKVGSATRNDMLMAEMLRTTSVNTLIDLRQGELGLKARLSAILDRQPGDTIGYAVISEEPVFDTPLDTLLAMTRSMRPMLMHDSLGIGEQEEMLTSARQEYYPDLRLGVSYMNGDLDMFRGWTVSAGITLPFVPWSIAKSGAGVEEAEYRVKQARESYESEWETVTGAVRETWLDLTGKLEQLHNFQSSMLPAADQALRSGLARYQDGQEDYQSVHQAYTAYLAAQTDYFRTRLEFETSLAKLRFETGYNGDFEYY
jgi:outer membrane protein TolC